MYNTIYLNYTVIHMYTVLYTVTHNTPLGVAFMVKTKVLDNKTKLKGI